MAGSPHLTTEQLAERLHRSPRTVEDWRTDGRGPAFIRDGQTVLYREPDIEAWEESCLVRHDQPA